MMALNPVDLIDPNLEKKVTMGQLQSIQDLFDKLAIQPVENLQDWYLKKQTKKEPGYVSESKTLLALVSGPISYAQLPDHVFMGTEEELEVGIPIQIQLEVIPKVIVPTASGTECLYRADISVIKARVKPGATAFVINEAKQIDHILNGTEDVEQQKKVEAKLIEKHQKKDEVNRFTGLEVDNDEAS